MLGKLGLALGNQRLELFDRAIMPEMPFLGHDVGEEHEVELLAGIDDQLARAAQRMSHWTHHAPDIEHDCADVQA